MMFPWPFVSLGSLYLIQQANRHSGDIAGSLGEANAPEVSETVAMGPVLKRFTWWLASKHHLE